jgi:hypothetical protein
MQNPNNTSLRYKKFKRLNSALIYLLLKTVILFMSYFSAIFFEICIFYKLKIHKNIDHDKQQNTNW